MSQKQIDPFLRPPICSILICLTFELAFFLFLTKKSPAKTLLFSAAHTAVLISLIWLFVSNIGKQIIPSYSWKVSRSNKNNESGCSESEFPADSVQAYCPYNPRFSTGITEKSDIWAARMYYEKSKTEIWKENRIEYKTWISRNCENILRNQTILVLSCSRINFDLIWSLFEFKDRKKASKFWNSNSVISIADNFTTRFSGGADQRRNPADLISTENFVRGSDSFSKRWSFQVQFEFFLRFN